ncbi:MAG: hypothetical protein AB1918_02715 [Pseudomonadota bacterium]
MLRNRQHTRKDWPTRIAVAADEGADIRVPVLNAALDRLDLHAFLYDPDYRRRLNALLDTLSDAEFDSFERQYTRRLTLN